MELLLWQTSGTAFPGEVSTSHDGWMGSENSTYCVQRPPGDLLSPRRHPRGMHFSLHTTQGNRGTERLSDSLKATQLGSGKAQP